MDTETIIAEVAKRHGFVLSPDDPILATATVVEIAWRQAGAELETRMAALWSAATVAERNEAASSRVQMACDRMVRDMTISMRGQVEGAHAQAREEMAANLASVVEAMREAVDDANKARHWAFAAAGLSGCIGLGIVLVLTAPVWMAAIHFGG